MKAQDLLALVEFNKYGKKKATPTPSNEYVFDVDKFGKTMGTFPELQRGGWYLGARFSPNFSAAFYQDGYHISLRVKIGTKETDFCGVCPVVNTNYLVFPYLGSDVVAVNHDNLIIDIKKYFKVDITIVGDMDFFKECLDGLIEDDQ